MSAHVVAKAKPFSEADEDEQTNLEGQWSEEGSTTVDQGQVADKLRTFGADTPLVRQPGGTGATTSAGSPLDEPTVDEGHQSPQLSLGLPPTRLVITQGNDTGRAIEIVPGKTYTIGRGLDNDFVLTDIAVSRKHFDLREEGNGWLVVDRGSGNGTVVNGNLEDHPFLLANGDLIEIGNTVFRFEAQVTDAPARGSPIDGDEPDEMSTVAGKPLRASYGDDVLTPEVNAGRANARPKTVPPPIPLGLRSGSLSQPPPFAQAPLAPGVQPLLLGGLPASTMPLPQMANRPPLGTQQAGAQAPTMVGPPITTLPGQAPTQLQGMAYGYPSATNIPPQSVQAAHAAHAQMLVIPQAQRNDGSTAHVPPTPYGGMPMQSGPYAQHDMRAPAPAASPVKRARMVAAGIGLVAFAAVVTIAIIKSGGSKPKAGGKQQAAASSAAAPAGGSTEPAKPTFEPIDPQKQAAAQAPAPTPAPAPAPKSTPAAAPAPVPKPALVSAPAPAPKSAPAPAPSPPPAPAPREVAKKAEPKTSKRAPAPAPKRVAVAAPADTSDITSHADELYRAKRFTEAANLLASAAKSQSGNEAQQLRHTADLYTRVGRALSAASAPATKPTEAYDQLQSAENFDRAVGGAFESEIKTKLGQVAPKAAIFFMASKDYPKARNAVIISESLGVANDSVQMVKHSLERAAGELYAQAKSEMSSNPESAKEKIRQIQQMVDQKNQWYVKAGQLRSGG